MLFPRGAIILVAFISLFTARSQIRPARPMEALMSPETPALEVRRPVHLMSAKRERDLRAYFPRVDDDETQTILDDPELILYTNAEMPKVYQFWQGQLQGVHSVDYNISADGGEPFGNGNIEFPWGTPAGTHRVRGLKSFRFLRLPEDESGNLLPVVWYRRLLSRDTTLGYAWTFPVGTVFGEVLVLEATDGKHYTFELRTRTRELDDWAVNVFRPFPTAASLARRIRELRPDYKSNEQLAVLVSHLESATVLPRRKLADDHPRRTFSQVAGVDDLPPVGDDQLAAELLTTTTFKSVLGETWRTGTNGNRAFAPTTRAGFHVIPARYDAGFIAVNRESCRRCHSTVNQSVDRFEFGRDWYGRVRGSDGIFSFHPFDPATISYNGMSSSVSMRKKLIDAGVLERYDPMKHDDSVYRQLKHYPE